MNHAYWNNNLRLTGVLLLAWFVLTFGTAWWARELNEWVFLGFPLGFYLAGQGTLVGYILIIAVYAWAMDRLDAEYGVAEEDEDGG